MKAVINYSGGGPAHQAKQDACQYASDHGMILCAATGNDNAGPVIFPAAYSTTISGVVGVGSTTERHGVELSNVGPEVTVVAPGSSILSTTPTYAVTIPGLGLNYGSLSGTSMATPLVTGLVALMWSRHPGHANRRSRSACPDSAVNLGAGEFDNSWGNGRVDALAALKCGDPVIVKSLLIKDCGIDSRLVVCGVKPTLTACVNSTLIACIESTLRSCRSKLPVLCPTTKLDTVCGPSSASSPSPAGSTRACAPASSTVARRRSAARRSTRSSTRYQPGVGGAINPAVQRPGVQREQWAAAPAADDPAAGPDWFYVDDEGRVHGWP